MSQYSINMGENTVAPLEATLCVEHGVIKGKSRDQCYSYVGSLARVKIILMGSRQTNVITRLFIIQIH